MNRRMIPAACFLAAVLGIAVFSSCRGKSAAPEALTGTAHTETAAVEESADPGEPLFYRYKAKTVNYPPKGGDFPYAFKGLKDTHIVEALTGEYSINRTSSNYQVFGTDLGIIFNNGDDVFIAFGDTFSGPAFGGLWRSNTLAVTRDHDASDGIRFDDMITNKVRSGAVEILRSRKQDNIEKTVIPTGGFSVNGVLYLCFMSVRRWGQAGQWDCNYGGIAKSVNNGRNWEKLAGLQWDGAGNFAQLCPAAHGEYVYFFGIGGGRSGRAALMRVPAGSVEDRDAYEYFTGFDEAGKPVYRSGSDAEKEPFPVIGRPVGEMSVMYNEYLGEWLAAYLGGEDLVIRSAKNLEGPWSPPHYIAKQQDYPGLYGAFMHPLYTEERGRVIYFLTSFWEPVYNVSVMRAEVVR